MTVTPLSSRDHSSPAVPRSHRGVARRRRITTSAEPAALTVSFEVTLAGESRYADALRILDTLRQVTDRLDTASLQVAPDSTPSPLQTVPLETLPTPVVSTLDTIEVLPDSRSVLHRGEQIALTRVEFDLLIFLADNPRRVFGRSQLLKTVWGYEHTGRRTVDVHVRRLRAKLGDGLVTTVRGIGYRLADAAEVRVVRLR